MAKTPNPKPGSSGRSPGETVAETSATGTQNRKPKLVCPACLKEVEYGDYAQMPGFVGEAFTVTSNFIECRGCGYYGLPITIEPEKKGGGKRGDKERK